MKNKVTITFETEEYATSYFNRFRGVKGATKLEQRTPKSWEDENFNLRNKLEIVHASLKGNVQTKKSVAKLMDEWEENDKLQPL